MNTLLLRLPPEIVEFIGTFLYNLDDSRGRYGSLKLPLCSWWPPQLTYCRCHMDMSCAVCELSPRVKRARRLRRRYKRSWRRKNTIRRVNKLVCGF
jgi:hypothetical protein